MKKTKGFTLVETIIAIILIAISSVAAFEFFQYCKRFIIESELRLSAANFAREVIEELDWDTEIDETTDWEDEPLPTGEEFGSWLSDTYNGQRKYRVKEYTDYKTIQVKVQWEIE